MGWPAKILVLPIGIIGLLITIKSLDYYSPNFSYGFLKGKEALFEGYYKAAFYGHILTSPVLLFIGTIQTFFRVEAHRPVWHKKLGKIYVYGVLFLGAPSGVLLGLHSIGGLSTHLAFVLLSALWLGYTFWGVRCAANKEFERHNRYMIRSYLLLLSAVLLRLYSFLFIHCFHWDTLLMYQTIVWLSWLPNLLIYEMVLMAGKTKAYSRIGR